MMGATSSTDGRLSGLVEMWAPPDVGVLERKMRLVEMHV
jgi:hypothetical protein